MIITDEEILKLMEDACIKSKKRVDDSLKKFLESSKNIKLSKNKSKNIKLPLADIDASEMYPKQEYTMYHFEGGVGDFIIEKE